MATEWRLGRRYKTDNEATPKTRHRHYGSIISIQVILRYSQNGPHILISRSRFSLNQIRLSLIVWLPLNVRLFIGIQKLLLVLSQKWEEFFIELLKYVPCLLVSKQFSLNGLKVFFPLSTSFSCFILSLMSWLNMAFHITF